MMNPEKIDKQFNKLLSKLNHRQFWKYISTWKDTEDLYRQMNEWDTETKAEAIKYFKEELKIK